MLNKTELSFIKKLLDQYHEQLIEWSCDEEEIESSPENNQLVRDYHLWSGEDPEEIDELVTGNLYWHYGGFSEYLSHRITQEMEKL